LPEVRDVVSGHVRPPLDVLVTLIHRVNPTGLELPDEIEAARYADKSALQSLLVSRHGDVLRVEATSDPDVVTLRLAGTGKDAAHAVVSTLSDRARTWIYNHLGDDEERHVTGGTSRGEGVGGDLAAGRAALAEWDYDGAQAHFEAAVARNPSTAAAVALLELLVDNLASYEEALGWADRLPAGAASVRLLLAVAAQSTGAWEEAERLLEGLDAARAAEVWVALGSTAVAAGELGRAERSIEAATRIDPAARGLLDLRGALDGARGALRAPAEATLSEPGLDDETLLRRAETVLEAWPDSEVAARIRGEVWARRRAAEIAGRLAAAEAAFAVGDWRRALESWASAVESGADEAELEDRRAQARAALDEERAARRVAEIQRALEVDARDEEALLAWLSLEGRGRVPPGPAELLARFGPMRGADARRLVRAALAVESASSLLAEGHLSAALGAVEQHARAGLPAMEALAGRIREAMCGAEERSVDEELAAIDDALDEVGGLPGIAAPTADLEANAQGLRTLRSRISAVRPANGAGGGRRDALAARVRRLEGPVRAGLRVQAARGRGGVLEARDGLEALLRMDPSLEADWGPLRVPVKAAVERVWRIEVHAPLDLPCPVSAVGRMGLDANPLWLTPDGKQIVVPRGVGSFLFLQWLEVSSGRVVRAVEIEAPLEMDVADVVVEADRIGVLLESRHVVFLSACGTRVLSCQSTIDESEAAVLVPGGRYAWFTHDMGTDTRLTVFDLHKGRAGRSPAAGWLTFRVPGDPPRVVREVRNEGGVVVCGGNGGTQAPGSISLPASAHGAAGLADGGVVLLEERDDGAVGVRAVDRSGRVRVGPELADSNSEQQCNIAADGERFYVAWDARGPRTMLAAFAADTLEQLWSIRVPGRVELASDSAGRWVLAIEPQLPEPPRLLGAEAPPAWSRLPRDPFLLTRYFLDWPFDSDWREAESARAALDEDGDGTLLSKLCAEGDIEELVLHVVALEGDTEEGAPAALAAIREALRARFSDRYEAAVTEAVLRLHAGRFDGVGELLAGPFVGDDFAESSSLAAASAYWRLQTGDFAGAVKSFEHGERQRPRSRMHWLARCLAGLEVEEVHPVANLVARVADSKTPEDDIAALDHPDLWRGLHRQAFARLVAAWFECPPSEPGARFRRLLAVATLVALEPASGVSDLAPGRHFDANLRVLGADWDGPRIRAVRERAVAWLAERRA